MARSKSLVELTTERSRANIVRTIETAVKRMEEAAADARRELRHIEKADTQDLTRLVARLISLGGWSHANIVSDLTNAISDIGELQHAEGVLETMAEAEKAASEKAS